MRFDREGESPRKSLSLSFREREVLYAWGTADNPKALPQLLQISEHTVLTYLKRARKKLGVRRTVDGWQIFQKEWQLMD